MSDRRRLNVQLIRLNKEIPLPEYATTGSAAIDLYADIAKDIVLFAGERATIGTGYKLWHSDPAWAGLILPRSGLGSNGLVLKNTVGLIDSDYQGELIIAAWNSNPTGSITIPSYKTGKAFAQYIYVPVAKAHIIEVDSFPETTARADGGFGSTDRCL